MVVTNLRGQQWSVALLPMGAPEETLENRDRCQPAPGKPAAGVSRSSLDTVAPDTTSPANGLVCNFDGKF